MRKMAKKSSKNYPEECEQDLEEMQGTAEEETPAQAEEPKAEAEAHSDAEKEWEEKYSQLEDKYLRLAAEYDNFKRRTQREKDALYADAVADAISGILPILDNLQRAAQSAEDASDVKTVAEGITMIVKAAEEAFEKMGVVPIEATGKEFDANLHNAVMHIEDDSVGANTVVEEFLKGYQYRDKVIRHSMVKVAN